MEVRLPGHETLRAEAHQEMCSGLSGCVFGFQSVDLVRRGEPRKSHAEEPDFIPESRGISVSHSRSGSGVIMWQ